MPFSLPVPAAQGIRTGGAGAAVGAGGKGYGAGGVVVSVSMGEIVGVTGVGAAGR
jgi:hypothetical protein